MKGLNTTVLLIDYLLSLLKIVSLCPLVLSLNFLALSPIVFTDVVEEVAGSARNIEGKKVMRHGSINSNLRRRKELLVMSPALSPCPQQRK